MKRGSKENNLRMDLKRFKRSTVDKKSLNHKCVTPESNTRGTDNDTKAEEESQTPVLLVPPEPLDTSEVSSKLLSLETELCDSLQSLKFPPPVEYIYSPVNYAFEVHATYVRRYGNASKKILFLGMNPGPWGMSQTGVPFGEISMVRDWLRISGPVGKPDREQPDRKVTGFECTRSEVSGKRFWGLFQELCGTPDNFFRHAYLHNYCPVALMNRKGGNITPAELKGEVQRALHSACDNALVSIIRLLEVRIVVGIGKFAEKRAQIVAKESNLSVQVLCLPHPSPRAVGNENWNDKAKQKLQDLELSQYFVKQLD